MAKKNTISFSIITVVIIIGYVSLTGSNQWGTNSTATNLTKEPLENSQVNIDEQTYTMQVTALIPPSETFERMVNDLPLTSLVNVSVDYLDITDLSYQNYVDFLLTKESGDIHLIPNEWIIPLAVQGYLMPLDRVVTTEYVEEQTNILVDSMKWNSNIWAAPYQLDPYIVIPHQSISHYFVEESELATEANSDIADDINKDISKESEISNVSSNTFDILQQIINTISADDILINLGEDGFKSLYHFLYYVDSNGITNGESLTEKQFSILSALSQKPSLVSEYSWEELIENEEVKPLFLVLKWSELSKYVGVLDKYYSIDNLIIPIHWTNGYSFVIKQQSKQQQIAGQWIEALHRKISESHITNVGMPIHKSNLNQLQVDWQKNVSKQFTQKQDLSNMMVVKSKWPIYFEQLQKNWLEEDDSIDRINMWLSSVSVTTK